MRFTVLLLIVFAATARGELHHLRTGKEAEWEEFRDLRVEGGRFEFEFKTQNLTNDCTIFLRQRDVKLNWNVQLNGETFTNLFLSEDDLLNAWVIPQARLRKGSNTLTIIPPKETDDIDVGDFLFKPTTNPFEGAVEVNAGGLPCRVTVVNTNGTLMPVRCEGTGVVVRPGVVYLGAGKGMLRLPKGSLQVYVGRGFEFGIQSRRIEVLAGSVQQLTLELKREVVTPGMVSCDTHVHTLTHSGHGDATEDERAITLAGEGIELPVATDHNINIDPEGPAKRTGMDRFYTAVRGVEVTTSHGHFNILPLAPDASPPDFRITDWPALMKEMRGTPGVQLVILNHPRNIHNQFQPFASTNFNAISGENLRGPGFSFDAIEVLNSSALQTDWMISFRDWMALLNYGYRVTAVGSSDCHDVSRYIVGQGRSYVMCDDSDVAHIDINRACENLRRGRVLVSMGLLTDMKVENRYSVGDLATMSGDEIHVTVNVQGPSWTAVDEVQLFANGEQAKTNRFSPIYSPGEKKRLNWVIPRPAQDLYLVAIASGPPVTNAFWRIPKPYQPTSASWKPRVVGATNPIWIDADGDGKFTPLRLQSNPK